MSVSLPVNFDVKSFVFNTAYILAVVFLIAITNRFFANFLSESALISVAVFYISHQALKEEGLSLLKGPLFSRLTVAICLIASLFIGLLFTDSFNV